MSLIAAILTPEQQQALEFYRALNVPAQWFIGEQDVQGSVEVIAVGENFVWSFLLSGLGECHSSEARLGDFTTGIDV